MLGLGFESLPPTRSLLDSLESLGFRVQRAFFGASVLDSPCCAGASLPTMTSRPLAERSAGADSSRGFGSTAARV